MEDNLNEDKRNDKNISFAYLGVNFDKEIYIKNSTFTLKNETSESIEIKLFQKDYNKNISINDSSSDYAKIIDFINEQIPDLSDYHLKIIDKSNGEFPDFLKSTIKFLNDENNGLGYQFIKFSKPHDENKSVTISLSQHSIGFHLSFYPKISIIIPAYSEYEMTLIHDSEIDYLHEPLSDEQKSQFMHKLISYDRKNNGKVGGIRLKFPIEIKETEEKDGFIITEHGFMEHFFYKTDDKSNNEVYYQGIEPRFKK